MSLKVLRPLISQSYKSNTSTDIKSRTGLICFPLPYIYIDSFAFIAERLSCPYFKLKGCGCLQAYIVGDGEFTSYFIFIKHVMSVF